MKEVDLLRSRQERIGNYALPLIVFWGGAVFLGYFIPDVAEYAFLAAGGGFSVNIVLAVWDQILEKRIAELESKI